MMYKVEQGKLKLKIWSGDWVEVKQPAVLFDLSREHRTALMLKHGELASVAEYKERLEKMLILAEVSDQSEYVLISVSDDCLNTEMQCILMNYFVEYTSGSLTYALATASSESRADPFQEILTFDEKLKSYGSY